MEIRWVKSVEYVQIYNAINSEQPAAKANLYPLPVVLLASPARGPVFLAIVDGRNSGDQISQPSSLLPKPPPLNQIILAVIVIFSNTCRIWTMYLCMDSLKIVLEASGAKAHTVTLIFYEGANILWQFADPFWGASIRAGASNRDTGVHISLTTWQIVTCGTPLINTN